MQAQIGKPVVARQLFEYPRESYVISPPLLHVIRKPRAIGALSLFISGGEVSAQLALSSSEWLFRTLPPSSCSIR